MTEPTTYDDVKLRAERSEDQGVYTVYLLIGDAQVAFGAVKIGMVDEARERAVAQKSEQQQPSDTA